MTDKPTHGTARGGGSAHEFPAGRLRSFEDEDDPGADLGTLLSRRAPLPGSTAVAEPPVAGVADIAPPPASDLSGAIAELKTAGVSEGARDGHELVAETTLNEPSDVVPNHGGRAAELPGASAARSPKSRVRASNVHIPVALLPAIDRGKKAAKLSNGELVIAALEACGDRLVDIIGTRTPTGGSLFAARATRTARSGEGPLTAFNVRLREEDYEVLDVLVERYGASSRGHLVTAALTDYLNTT